MPYYLGDTWTGENGFVLLLFQFLKSEDASSGRGLKPKHHVGTLAAPKF